LQASWESIALTFQAVLFNGGPVALVYGIIIATIGSMAIAASLGEMASIEPTVGAQYRWTSRHTPKKLDPKFWGLLQGTTKRCVRSSVEHPDLLLRLADCSCLDSGLRAYTIFTRYLGSSTYYIQ
jgi:hypothetical protein